MPKPTQASLEALIEQAIQRTREMVQTESSLAERTKVSQATSVQVAALIDHTLLKPDAKMAQIQQLCAEASEYGLSLIHI